MPDNSVEANTENTEPALVFYRTYSIFFGIVNTNISIGIGILKYSISVRFFGKPTQD